MFISLGSFHITKPHIAISFQINMFANLRKYELIMNQLQDLSKQRAGDVPDSDKSSRSESIVRSKDLFCVHTGVSVINVAVQYSLYSGSRKNYVTVCVCVGRWWLDVSHASYCFPCSYLVVSVLWISVPAKMSHSRSA